MLMKNILGELRTQLSILLQKPRTQLPILLGDSKNLQEGFTPKQRCYENCKPKITKIGEARTQFAIILQDSKNLGEGLA